MNQYIFALGVFKEAGKIRAERLMRDTRLIFSIVSIFSSGEGLLEMKALAGIFPAVLAAVYVETDSFKE
jgi:hypothetical protein